MSKVSDGVIGGTSSYTPWLDDHDKRVEVRERQVERDLDKKSSHPTDTIDHARTHEINEPDQHRNHDCPVLDESKRDDGALSKLQVPKRKDEKENDANDEHSNNRAFKNRIIPSALDERI